MSSLKEAKAVQRSLPSLTRPRLPTSTEQRLAEIDQKNAVCYANVEQISEKARELAQRLEDEYVECIEDESVPHEINWGDTSIVQHIEHAKAKIKTADEIAADAEISSERTERTHTG